jgi:hypothetical protein
MSHRIEDRAVPGRVSVYDTSLRICEDRCRIHKCPLTGHIFDAVQYDILKLWLTPISAQFCLFFVLHVGTNRKNT